MVYLAYRSEKELKIARILRSQKQKVLVTDGGGRTESVKQVNILTEFMESETAGCGDVADLERRVDEVAAEIDSRLLWEILVDSSVELELRQATEEYFGSVSALRLAAIAGVLLADTLHFRRKGENFIPRSRSEVASLEQSEQRAVEKQALHEQAMDFFRKIITVGHAPSEVPPELEGMIGRIESFMFRDDNAEAESWLGELAGSRPVREVGLEILEKLDRLNPSQDPQLLLYGIVADFSEAVLNHTERLVGFTVDPDERERVDFRDWSSFSIDDESTSEVDDALSVRVGPDGSTEVGIHIADPSVFVHRGDCVDRTAAERALTLYLPTCTINMLPPRIGCDLASLEPGLERPSVSVLVKFNPAGEISDYSVERGVLQVRRRLSYTEADRILGGGVADSAQFPASALLRLFDLANSLQQSRRARGALVFTRPEISVSVRDDQIRVESIAADSPSRMLVSEFMILVNRLIAEYALAHDIPIIYRTQPAPRGQVEPPAEYDPVLFERTVRMMRPTRFSTHPQPHSSLALDVYTQISSPLRRFNDLAIHRQLTAHLRGQSAPYTRTGLIEVLGQAERVERSNKRVERELNNYWLMEHIRRQYLNTRLDATMVDPVGNMRLAELDRLMVRGIVQGGESYRPGTRVKVKVVEVNPRKNRMILLLDQPRSNLASGQAI